MTKSEKTNSRVVRFSKQYSIIFIVLLHVTFVNAEIGLKGLPCSLNEQNGIPFVDHCRVNPEAGVLLPWGQQEKFCYFGNQKQQIHYLGFALAANQSLEKISLNDLEVYSNGDVIPKDYISVQHGYYGDVGLYVSFLFDQSWAVNDFMLQSKLSAGQILAQLSNTDKICLTAANFTEKANIIRDWQAVGDNVQIFKNEINGGVKTLDLKNVPPLENASSVRIYDAMNSIIDSFSEETPDQLAIERKLLVVFSTLEDDASVTSFETVKNNAIGKNVKIIIIHPEKKNYNESHADTFAQSTGGRVWQANYNKTNYREDFEVITAPHLGLVVRLPSDICPGDGLNHSCSILLNSPVLGKAQIDAGFVAQIFTAKSFWERILAVSIPVFLGMLIIGGLMVATIQIRGRRYSSNVSLSTELSANDEELSPANMKMNQAEDILEDHATS